MVLLGTRECWQLVGFTKKGFLDPDSELKLKLIFDVCCPK